MPEILSQSENITKPPATEQCQQLPTSAHSFAKLATRIRVAAEKRVRL